MSNLAVSWHHSLPVAICPHDAGQSASQFFILFPETTGKVFRYIPRVRRVISRAFVCSWSLRRQSLGRREGGSEMRGLEATNAFSQARVASGLIGHQLVPCRQTVAAHMEGMRMACSCRWDSMNFAMCVCDAGDGGKGKSCEWEIMT